MVTPRGVVNDRLAMESFHFFRYVLRRDAYSLVLVLVSSYGLPMLPTPGASVSADRERRRRNGILDASTGFTKNGRAAESIFVCRVFLRRGKGAVLVSLLRAAAQREDQMQRRATLEGIVGCALVIDHLLAAVN